MKKKLFLNIKDGCVEIQRFKVQRFTVKGEQFSTNEKESTSESCLPSGLSCRGICEVGGLEGEDGNR